MKTTGVHPDNREEKDGEGMGKEKEPEEEGREY
jgi:hypothetical protein